MQRGVSLLLLLTLAGCKCSEPAAPPARPASRPSLPVDVLIAYGSEKKTWLEEQIPAFLATHPKTQSGKEIRIGSRAMGSGETVQDILGGTIKPHVFSPASGAYITVLNERWQSTAGHTRPLCPPGEPVVLSPLVIAMWKPMAETLGWPNKALGWSDLLSVNANPKGWGAFDRAEWGTFKLGHTNPEFSNSGLLSVLAEAYAGAKKTRGLTSADLDAKQTHNFIRAVEQTIVHYGKSTGFFADKMLERGPSYVSAAVLYENLVIESYAKNSSGMPVVAIYLAIAQLENAQGRWGNLKVYYPATTIWSDHPAALLDGSWVTEAQKKAGRKYLSYLRSRAQQEQALRYGFRPADPSIPLRTAESQNPFTRLAQYGINVEIPPAAGTPSGPVVRNLITMWSRVVANR